MQGGSAVSAVQAAVNALEDNPVFDAGKILIKQYNFFTCQSHITRIFHIGNQTSPIQ